MRLTSYIYETCDKVIPTWSITQESIFTLAWRWNRSTIARSVLVVSWWMLSIYRHSAFWTSPRNTLLGTSWNAKNGCLVSSNHWTLWILMKLQQKKSCNLQTASLHEMQQLFGLMIWWWGRRWDGMEPHWLYPKGRERTTRASRWTESSVIHSHGRWSFLDVFFFSLMKKDYYKFEDVCLLPLEDTTRKWPFLFGGWKFCPSLCVRFKQVFWCYQIGR